MYDQNNDGYYEVGDDIVLTSWRSPRGILGTAQLLHVQNVLLYTSCTPPRNRLEEMGHNPLHGERSYTVSHENY